MSSTKDQKTTQEETQHEHTPIHIHGPHCNHGHEALKPIVRENPKIGRNDPCICGSQKKYKKCCG